MKEIVSPSIVAASSNGLYLIPGPTDRAAQKLATMGAVAAAIPAGRHAWDVLGGLPDIGTVDHPDPTPALYAQHVEQIGKPVVFMALRNARDAAAAYAMAEVTTVVARLHCIPTENGIKSRLGNLLPDGAECFDTVFRGIVD